MNADDKTVPTNAADETERVNQEQAQAPSPLSTQAAHENFQNLQGDDSVAVDQRVPSGPLNSTVTADQPVTDPALARPEVPDTSDSEGHQQVRQDIANAGPDSQE